MELGCTPSWHEDPNQKGGLELQALVHFQMRLGNAETEVGGWGVTCLGLGGCGHLSRDAARSLIQCR